MSDDRWQRPRGRSVPPDAPKVPGVDLLEVLGRGGMGLVYRGRQGYLERDVAVKFLDVRTARGEFEARFRREARLLAGITHPNIVACYQAGTTDEGVCYLVMEYIEGPDLKQWIDEHGSLEPEIAVSVCRDVAVALEHAHRMGIIHRDVKPANVFLGRDSELTAANDPFPFIVKLGDLGLARPSSTEVEGGEEVTQLTQGWVGSPATMAPEQFDDGKSVDHRADIYGLGCVLYHALTGQLAFGGSHSAVIKKKLERYGPDPRTQRPGLSKGMGRLVRRLLASDPDERPATYAELLELFDAFLEGEPVGGRRVRPAFVVAGLLVGVLAVAAIFLWPTGDRRAGSLTVGPVPETRAGWEVELASVSDGLDDWEWSWVLLEPADLPVELQGSDTPRATFIAPAVDAMSELLFRARAIRDDGETRQETVRVTVQPALAPAIDAPPFADEGDTVTFGATPGEGVELGARTYRWSVLAAPGVPTEHEGERLDLTIEEARADYEVEAELTVLEDGRAAGTSNHRLTVRADDDRPRLLGGVEARWHAARPGESIELGGAAADPEGAPVTSSWSLAPESQLDDAERQALAIQLSAVKEPRFTLTAPAVGSVVVLVLTLEDGTSEPTEERFEVRVPAVRVVVPTQVAEGETITLEVELPDGFPAADQLSFAWSLERLAWGPEDAGRLVLTEGRPPASPGDRPTPPTFGDSLERGGLEVLAGSWDQPRLELRAPRASHDYDLDLALAISGAGIEERSPVRVRVVAKDEPPALYLVTEAVEVNPLEVVTLEAVAFDPDSELADDSLAELAWTEPALSIPGRGRAAVTAPQSGELEVVARTPTLGEARLSVRVRGGLALDVTGELAVSEGADVDLMARVVGTGGAEIEGPVADCTFTWWLLGAGEARLWDPGQAVAAPQPWSARADLAGGREGGQLKLAAPESDASYALQLKVEARRDDVLLASRTLELAVTADDDAPVFDLTAFPETLRAGQATEGAWQASVRDRDTAIVSAQWLLDTGSGPKEVAQPAAFAAAGIVPWPAGLAFEEGEARITVRVSDPEGRTVDSPVRLVRVLPAPALDLAESASDAKEGESFVLRARASHLGGAEVRWGLAAIRSTGAGRLHVAPASPAASSTPEAISAEGIDLEAAARWLGSFEPDPRSDPEDESTSWTLRAPQADAPYELVLTVRAQLGAERVEQTHVVAVEASDDPATLRLAPVLVTGPQALVPLFAELIDVDTPSLSRRPRWALEAGGAARLLDADTRRPALDVSAFTEPATVWLEVSADGVDPARVAVRVEPALAGFPTQGLDLTPAGTQGEIPGWQGRLLVLPGGDASVSGATVTPLRWRENDDWAHASFRSGERTAGLLEFPLPSRLDFEASAELGVRNETAIEGLGLLVLEAGAPGAPVRAVGVRLSGGAEVLEELIYLELSPIDPAEAATLEPAAADLALARSGPITVLERVAESGRSTCWGRQDQVSEYLALDCCEIRVERRRGELVFSWSGRSRTWTLPEGFEVGGLALWTESRNTFVRGVRLEPR